MSLDVGRIRPEEGLALRAIRLRALREAPMAFGSTLAREEAFAESVWHERATGAASGPGQATFVAREGDRWIGLATGLGFDPDGEGHAPMLVGMFVEPASRRAGVGAALVEAVAAWAQAGRATHLYLWVTSTNAPAIALYEKCGFTRLAAQRPLGHTPAVLERLMVRALR